MIISNNLNDFINKLNNGNIVCFKTDTIWGFSANSNNTNAIENLYRIKQRNLDKPFIFLIKKDEDISKYVKDVPAEAKKLINKFWSGPLTIIFQARENLPLLSPYKKNKTIALRMPQDELTQQILSKINYPIPSTSVNIEGKPSLNTFEEISKEFKDEDFFILNVDNNQNTNTQNFNKNLSSTIVSFATGKLEIIREGAISKEKILSALC